ncbi:MAG: hypothetical protein J5I50_04595 [Chitinophagaceae bacterium]|nr:hypothetical protein [Chitinophagaceae bacterium]
MKANLYVLYILLLCVVLRPQETSAQSFAFDIKNLKVEAGINIGPSFFLGDLGGNRGEGTRFIKDINFSLTNIMGGAFVVVHPNDWLGFRVAAQYGKLQGDDTKIKRNGGAELYRKQRNLDFRTKLAEAYIAAEVYPLEFLFGEYQDFRLSPYGVIGVGVYHYNPQGSLTDANGNKTWHYLKPLHTEGQGFDEYPDRKEYSLTQINIPMGVGIRYHVTEQFNISLEMLLRKSFNDYVDDVSTDYVDPVLFDKYLTPQQAAIAKKIADKSNQIAIPGMTRYAPGEQRGNPNQNDSWFTTFIKLGWKFTRNEYKSSLSKMRCPHRF